MYKRKIYIFVIRARFIKVSLTPNMICSVCIKYLSHWIYVVINIPHLDRLFHCEVAGI
jgi:hypothetical protein